MTVNITAVKQNSRIILKNKLTPAFFVFVVAATFFLIDGMLSSLLTSAFKGDAVWGVLSPARLPLLLNVNNLIPTVIMLVFRVFVLMPVVLGTMRWFWRMINEKDDVISSVFYYYGSRSNFKRALNITLVFGAWTALLGVISMLAYYLVSFVSSDWLYDMIKLAKPEIFASGALINFILLICRVFFVYLLIRVIGFIPLAVIMEDKAPKDVFAASVKIFADYSWKTLGLLFSFIGWFALSLLIAPLIFAGPYFITAVVLFVKYAVNNYNLKNFPGRGI